jgi:hypothetical protein
MRPFGRMNRWEYGDGPHSGGQFVYSQKRTLDSIALAIALADLSGWKGAAVVMIVTRLCASGLDRGWNGTCA